MSAPVNLNKARKARARAAQKTRADENAIVFGRPKAEKAAQKTRADKAARDLEAHKRER
ncbi:DUF4169 family protein [Roseovarius spongiae]|uniref:DUF4169 family protein n=1 Tax=Roseovarius spongiae TaxID=2320272 RepID=A0A3A8AWL9_9RHOB|nr:DUF4169 family protein [Roseovarius spongiae]RKF15120.1 DUF4169 family protein [Roseovarius spongiae]